ncbi:hypothetical protein EST38_g14138 [Candolleomyces aberdarensis]|uniref:Uncharacterized protein n=1 Tax=Candolleomyces aberdarensis TaxID=2316362 RepID=A0A4Q2CZW8_9AGAR|nr:hypothetical protein EST38_g14138 [Candolleomyces aberdarensis]
MPQDTDGWENMGDGIMMKDGSSPQKSNPDRDVQMNDDTGDGIKGQLGPGDPSWTEQQWALHKDSLFRTAQRASSTTGSHSIPLQPATPGVVDPVPNHVSQVVSSTEALKILENSVRLSLTNSRLNHGGAGPSGGSGGSGGSDYLGGSGGSGESGGLGGSEGPEDTNPSVKNLIDWNLHSIGAVAVSSEFLDSHLRDLDWMRTRLEEHFAQTLRLRLIAEKNLAAIERALFMESRRNMLAEAVQKRKEG